MKLTYNQQKLLDFVTIKHGDQKRKYTGEPYVIHLINVADLVSKYETICTELALCHDLFEDTNCNFNELFRAMTSFCGYTRSFAYDTCKKVTELTDVFTAKDYPYLNRKIRKINECERLSSISYESQCVKYADLIDNTLSITQHDKGFAEVYLQEKSAILDKMTGGHPDLYNYCKRVLERSMQTLSIEP
jgi:(p)ppGpp synthase/HD superfamily hydrolase